MKFNKIIALPALALTMWGLGACTDEVKYDPAEELTTPQVYFPTTTPSSIEIEENQTSVTINVERVNTTGAITVPVTASATVGGEATDIFTVSTVAAFTDGSNTAPISIDFDFAKIKQETDYTIVLNIEGADLTPYGKSQQTVTLKYAPWSAWKTLGASVYTNNTPWGFVEEQPIQMRTSLVNPDLAEYRYAAGTLFANELVIQLNKSTNAITVPLQDTGQKTDGNKILVADMYTMASKVLSGQNPALYEHSSYFNPETGVMTIAMCFIIDKGGGSIGWWGPDNFDYIQLPGYPDYAISVSNDGAYVSEDSKEYAILNIVKGTDVANYAFHLYPGALNAKAVAEKVAGIKDAIKADTEELYSASRSFQIQMTQTGYYTAIVVPVNAAGEVQEETVYTFRYEMQTVDWNAGWKTLTKVVDGKEVPVQALYSDAFFAGLIMRQPMQWFVTVQESIKYPGYYRVVKPYAEEIDEDGTTVGDYYGYPCNRGHFYLYIDATDPDNVVVEPSATSMGFYLGSIAPGKLVDGTKFEFPANSVGVYNGYDEETGEDIWLCEWEEKCVILDLDPKEDEEEEDAQTASFQVPMAKAASSVKVPDFGMPVRIVKPTLKNIRAL